MSSSVLVRRQQLYLCGQEHLDNSSVRGGGSPVQGCATVVVGDVDVDALSVTQHTHNILESTRSSQMQAAVAVLCQYA